MKDGHDPQMNRQEEHFKKILVQRQEVLKASLDHLKEQFNLLERKKQELSKNASSGKLADIQEWNDFQALYEASMEQLIAKKSSMREKIRDLVQDETLKNSETGQALMGILNSRILQDKPDKMVNVARAKSGKRFIRNRI